MQEAHFTIRPVSPEDNQRLAEIIRGIFIEYSAEKKGTVYSDPTTDHLYELFQVKKSALWLVELKGEIMGCCGIFPTEGLNPNCVELVKYYIHSKGRGLGLGKALMEKCLASAKNLGFSEVYIESLPEFKEAVRIYQRQGFEELAQPLTDFGHPGCTLWFLKSL